MKREVLLLSSNFPPVVGGSSVVYDHICRELPDHVAALAPQRSYSSGEPLAEDAPAGAGYAIHRIEYLRPPTFAKNSRSSLAMISRDIPIMLSVLYNVVRISAKCGAKTICIGDLVPNGWLVFPLRYLFRRKVIIYTHGEEISQAGNSTAERFRHAYLAHAHAIVSVSDFCRGQIISTFGIPEDRIFVVPNGVDLTVFQRGAPDPAVLPEPIRGKRIILSVSRLVERKGQEKLIAAMSRIAAEVPDAHCVLVGTGPLAERLKQAAADHGVTSNITFLGGVSQDDLVRLYRSSELFALPCRTLADGDTEGFGLVFLEANACGLPVVAGAAGGTVEAVADGETGLLVDGNEVPQIAEAVLKLLRDRGYARHLAQTGWERSQSAGWDVAARRFLAVCRGTAQASRAGGYHPSPDALAFAPADHEGGPARLLLTVDLEEQFDWNEFPRTGFRVGGAGELAKFHESCRALKISPVYLVTYAIMEEPAFRDFLNGVLDDGSAEVGIHLHSWNTPPHWEFINSFNSFQCNLPAYMERRKLEVMCTRFERAFGRYPRIHRAGRWGGSDRTAELLEELGLEVDLSPCPPFFDARGGGPDFRGLDHDAFWAGARGNVLTVPASSAMFVRGPDRLSDHLIDGRWLPASVMGWMRRNFGSPVRFTPEGQPTARLLRMARRLRRRPVSVFTLHSTSLYDGGNQYAATAEEAAALHERCAEVLRACLASGFQATTCAQLYRDALRLRASSASEDATARPPVTSFALGSS